MTAARLDEQPIPDVVTKAREKSRARAWRRCAGCGSAIEKHGRYLHLVDDLGNTVGFFCAKFGDHLWCVRDWTNRKTGVDA